MSISQPKQKKVNMSADYEDVSAHELRVAHETRELIRAVIVAIGQDEPISRSALQLRLEAAGVPFYLNSDVPFHLAPFAINFVLEYETDLVCVSQDAVAITNAGREWLKTEGECARELLNVFGKSDDDAQEDLRAYCHKYDFLGQSILLNAPNSKKWFELLALVMPRDGIVWTRDIHQRLVVAGMSAEASTNLLRMSNWATFIDGVTVLTTDHTAADFDRDVGEVPIGAVVDYSTLTMTDDGRKLADLNSARDTRPVQERLADLIAQDAPQDRLSLEVVLAVIGVMKFDSEIISGEYLIDRLVATGMTSIQAEMALEESQLRAIDDDGASAVQSSDYGNYWISDAGLRLFFENRTRNNRAAAMDALAEMDMG